MPKLSRILILLSALVPGLLFPVSSAGAMAPSSGALNDSQGLVKHFGSFYGYLNSSYSDWDYVQAQGFNSVCKIQPLGTVYCFGGNYLGQLGNGSYQTVASADKATQVLGLTGVLKIAEGDEFCYISASNEVRCEEDVHRCALLSDGQVSCWGGGESNPKLVPQIRGATDISEGHWGNETCAVTTSGVYCWAPSWDQGVFTGQVAETDPIKIAGTEDVVTISFDGGSACGVTKSSEVKCWGGRWLNQNASKSSGVSCPDLVCEARLVKGLQNVVAVKSYMGNACALTSNGNLWCWGSNGYGLFNGDQSQRGLEPVVTFTNVKDFTFGDSSAIDICEISTSSQLFCKGNDFYSVQGLQDGFGLAVDATSHFEDLGLCYVNDSKSANCPIFRYNDTGDWIVESYPFTTQLEFPTEPSRVSNNDTSMSLLEVDGKSLVDGYTLNLFPYTTSVDVVATPTDPNASVQITGATSLQTGDNTLTVTVTAADGTTTQVYTVDLNVMPSSNTELRVFEVNGIDVSSGATLSLDAAATSVDVTAVPADSNATVEINGDTDLSTGDNPLTVTVTAVDGSTQDYVVDLNVGLSSDTSLSSFQVNGVDVQDGDTVVLPYGTSAVDVFAQPSDLDASYEIIGDTGLQDGGNTLTIRVTAADGIEYYYYNVTLIVAAGDDASLASLQINGQDAFNGDTLDLDPDTTSVDVVAIANDPNATVEITGDTDLVSGDNTLDITVTSSDGNTTQLYELDLRVAMPTFEAMQPSVSGDGSVGGMLTVDPGDWGSGATYSFQWLRDGMPIKGQTSDSYVPGFFDYQHVLSVQVTGQAEGYDPVTVTSDSVTVTVGSLDDAISGNTCNNASLDSSNWATTQGAAPSIVGAPLVSKTLSSTPGVWGKGLKYCRLWVENGQVVNNLSSGARFHTTTSDIDQVLQLVVVATDRQGNSTFRFSQPVTIQKLTFVKANAPVVAGNPRVKATLRAKYGPWARGVDYSYQWLRNGKPIDGANAITYKLTTDDKQTQISVQLCGHNDNYNDLCLTSNPTTIN